MPLRQVGARDLKGGGSAAYVNVYYCGDSDNYEYCTTRHETV